MARTLEELRQSIQGKYCWEETQCIQQLLAETSLTSAQRENIQQKASSLILRARELTPEQDSLDALLHEFDLSTNEGVALMCLAEALLRIPDNDTADDLIQEKLMDGDWEAHLKKSDSVFVNASTWALMLGERWVELEGRLHDSSAWVSRLMDKFGAPVFRTLIKRAIKVMAEQYILGHDVPSSLKRSKKIYPKSMLFSFDALGEGARTNEDAMAYQYAYEELIDYMSDHDHPTSVHHSHSISIKLSALHPRYQWRKKDRVIDELLPRLLQLCYQARDANVGLSIDAEESERLSLSLLLFEKIAQETTLRKWNGLGFVLQAYQKRACDVALWLRELSHHREAPFNARLVKGAYWDREIKRAQQLGLSDYPVFTRKVSTDLSYLRCAQILFSAGDNRIYPQFATHNASTIAQIEEIAPNEHYEFQRLHGMGGLLYRAIDERNNALGNRIQQRVYAPIGQHHELLPYLARRLLENGANTSFINRFLDNNTAPESLASDPLTIWESKPEFRHSKIPLPRNIYPDRKNSLGMDLEQAEAISIIENASRTLRASLPIHAGSIVDGETIYGRKELPFTSVNPANTSEVIGHFAQVSQDSIVQAVASATNASHEWDASGGTNRAARIKEIAETLEANKPRLISLIILEAGRSALDAEAEVREAIDFCYYYALQAEQHFAEPTTLIGPTGEHNQISMHGRGVFLSISPWNFPMAIFVGQVIAALAAGNCVLAKPAEQTSLVAYELITLMHQSGIPKNVLHLLLGEGESIGEATLKDDRVSGVAFTGSNHSAERIAAVLHQRSGPTIPFIAETGGINCMIVDSSALLEQVVDDVLHSAFMSAGQRCSSLRVLYLQNEIYDETLRLLKGACDQIDIGATEEISSDIGPVIDQRAMDRIKDYLNLPHISSNILYKHSQPPKEGLFIGPHIIAAEKLDDIQHEVFGPVLHVIRFQRNEINSVIQDINRSDFALTLGIQSRIESWSENIFQQTKIGNTYINRHMVGAVVGVQPFGGHKRSGTGPKAGGPNYLQHFAIEKSKSINTVATGGDTVLINLEE